MSEGKPPPADRLEVSLSGPLARSPASIEYRTIPPTINVRYKQRPPPLRLFPFATSASSLATSAPPESAKWSFSASLSTFPESPYTPLSPTSGCSNTVQIADALSPPPDPEAYLRDRPWDFAEYLHLLGIATALAPAHPAGWVLVTAKFNSSTLGRAPRSSWECFHRFTVPWLATPSDIRACGTYPHVVGVQHAYEHVGLQRIIDDYVTFARVLGHGDRIPTRRPGARQTRPNPALNVPPGTLGHIKLPGSSPWFHTPVIQRPDSPRPTLPSHLRHMRIPSPRPSPN
ncbi:hypothetical protein PENSPDRAFT_223705 [Peniophora sp. CONT]|nr:hypothetical protein PENSPDRAFT_223705 [Peniophora sp. CONT]